jgi:HAD domain in Swiss Army Knife RNA repair proteins
MMYREQPITQPTDRSSAKSKSVIFLDIDGVLNRGSSDGEHRVDSDLLVRFQSLVSSTNARVVLASTWRHDPAGVADARRLGIPFDDVLPDLRPKSRGDEIKAWLATHPGTDRFVILDDEDDGYGDFPLFQPSPSRGLTPKLASALSSYLSGERKKDARRNVVVCACQALWFSLCGHKG